MRRREIKLPGQTGVMAAREWGPEDRAIDLVFLHANGFHGGVYRTILAPLGAHWRILAADLRGHGATTLAANAEHHRGWAEVSDDAVALAVALGVTNAVWAGHSMGATAAVTVAAARPEAVRSIVGFDPVAPPPPNAVSSAPDQPNIRTMTLRRRAEFPDRETARQSYRGRGAFTGWPDEMLDDYIQDGFRDLPSGGVTLACAPVWEAGNYGATDNPLWRAMAKSTAPIRLLLGETNSTFRWGGEAEALKGGERVSAETIPGSNHFLPMQFPDLARDELSRALSA